jgi:hypothetical protein
MEWLESSKNGAGLPSAFYFDRQQLLLHAHVVMYMMSRVSTRSVFSLSRVTPNCQSSFRSSYTNTTTTTIMSSSGAAECFQPSVPCCSCCVAAAPLLLLVPATTIVPSWVASVRQTIGGRIIKNAWKMGSLSAPHATAMDIAPVGVALPVLVSARDELVTQRAYANVSVTPIVPIWVASARKRFLARRAMETVLKMNNLSVLHATAMNSAPLGNAMTTIIIKLANADVPATPIVTSRNETTVKTRVDIWLMENVSKMSSLSVPHATTMHSAPLGVALVTIPTQRANADVSATPIVRVWEASVREQSQVRGMDNVFKMSSLSTPDAMPMNSAPVGNAKVFQSMMQHKCSIRIVALIQIQRYVA